MGGGVFRGSKIKDAIRIDNVLIRECLAESLGTFILVTFCLGSVAQATLPPQLNHSDTLGSSLSVSLGSGLGLAMGLWCSMGVSGGHLNPAMTLALSLIGRLPLYKVPIYFLGQYVGAFAAAACVYGLYVDALNSFDGGVRAVKGENATAGIFATYPLPHVSTASAFGDQVFVTMLFVLCVVAITDQRNMGCETGILPLTLATLIVSLGLAFSGNCGAPMNPARDLSPRVFTALAGWGAEVFTAYDFYFWVPVVGPHIGGVCGAWIYVLLVGVHIEDDDEPVSYTVSTARTSDERV